MVAAFLQHFLASLFANDEHFSATVESDFEKIDQSCIHLIFSAQYLMHLVAAKAVDSPSMTAMTSWSGCMGPTTTTMGHDNLHTFLVASVASAAFVEDWTYELVVTAQIDHNLDFLLNSAACLLDRMPDIPSLPLFLWPIFKEFISLFFILHFVCEVFPLITLLSFISLHAS